MISHRNARARRPQSHLSPRPLVEHLEHRTLLAGNVTTTPLGTPNSPGQLAPFLNIQGDPLGNEILIKKGGTPDEIIVSGLNGTLVNGSTQEQHFRGVRLLEAFMDGGNDDVKLTNLKLSATPGPVGDPFEFVVLFSVVVDGGIGDDRINVSNTTLNAKADPSSTSSVAMILSGEETNSTTGVTTGNDWIDVNNTTLIAEGGEMSSGVLTIFGDRNAGGTITGGNDHINVSNTVVRATNSFLDGSAFAAIQIFGDVNSASTLETSVIGQGNDWIDVNNTDIIANSAQGSALAIVSVYGDDNFADIGGIATIGNFAAKTGGNDTISITNTTVSAMGANFSNNSVMVDVRGDQNFTQAGVADIGGGNDNISIKNFAASTFGLSSDNTTELSVFGDGDVRASLIVTSRVGGGNDVISLTNDDIFASGNRNNEATVEINSDDANQQGEAGTIVGQGNDSVQISNFLLEASSMSNMQLATQKGRDIVDIHNSEVGGLGIDTGSGNDDLTILNSDWVSGNFNLRAGNDLLKMNGNSFVTTDADGDAGFDRLFANNNTGVITARNFEEINGMPSPPLVIIM